MDKAEFLVSFEQVNPKANPVMITQNEYMRRMKEMAAMQPGMSFYGELPDSYNLIVNVASPVVGQIMKDADANLIPQLKPMNEAISTNSTKAQAVRDEAKDGKLTDDQQNQIKHFDEDTEAQRHKINHIVSDYAKGQPLVKQVIDLALLANGLLRGADLNEFIRRSVSLLK